MNRLKLTLLAIGIMIFMIGCQKTSDSIDASDSIARNETDKSDFGDEERSSDAMEDSEDIEDTEDTEGTSYIEVINKDLSVLKDTVSRLTINENTVLVLTSVSYNAEAVDKLNAMLGDDLKMILIDFENYSYSKEEIVSYLKENQISIDVVTCYLGELRSIVNSSAVRDITSFLESDDGKKLKGNIPDLFWEASKMNDCYYGPGTITVYENGWIVNPLLVESDLLSEDNLSRGVASIIDKAAMISERFNGSVLTYNPAFVTETMPYYLPYEALPIGCRYDEEKQTIELYDLFDDQDFRKEVMSYNALYSSGLAEPVGSFMDADAALPDILISRQENVFPDHRQDHKDIWSYGGDYLRINDSIHEPDDVSVALSCITSWTDKYDLALRLLSEIYTSKEASELLIYGIPDKDYVVLEDGSFSAIDSDGKIIYLEDDMYLRSLGNLYLCKPMNPYEDNYKFEYHISSDDFEIPISLAGFCFDPLPVIKEFEAVSEIYNFIPNRCGLFAYPSEKSEVKGSSIEEYYDAIHEAMLNAGLNTIMTEMQKQLISYMEY